VSSPSAPTTPRIRRGTPAVYVPFNRSYAPGPKPFDFDINQISFTPARAKVVSFSSSYYDVNQALVVRKGTPIARARSIAGLEPYKLGAQLGTTSYTFIQNTIKPSKSPAVFPQNAAAVQALKNGQIDGLVVDLPTAFYVTAVQVPNSTILGQFPAETGGEHFGMVFAKGNPLVSCVDRALASLRSSGQLKKIQQQWLAKATGAPVLK
jgi:polar amino acid transport system substrate-binding protein